MPLFALFYKCHSFTLSQMSFFNFNDKILYSVHKPLADHTTTSIDIPQLQPQNNLVFEYLMNLVCLYM